MDEIYLTTFFNTDSILINQLPLLAKETQNCSAQHYGDKDLIFLKLAFNA